MTQAEKLEALVRKVDCSVITNAVPETKGFPLEQADLVAQYLIINHRVLQLLFNPDFARALFGEDKLHAIFEDGEVRDISRDITKADEENLSVLKLEKPIRLLTSIPGLQTRLQQAVISKDPIDYMYKAVFGDTKQ